MLVASAKSPVNQARHVCVGQCLAVMGCEAVPEQSWLKEPPCLSWHVACLGLIACGSCRPQDVPEPAERLPRPSAAADESGAAEHMLLGALETLYADASEADAQLGILRVVLALLQRHGELCCARTCVPGRHQQCPQQR